jgi:NAD(P)-dependent dehydrogenase (short-subunit alcohol dehydrogenase family)
MASQEVNESTGQRGSIVAISSISALMGGGEQCHYTPTKAGIKSLMESTAIALGPLGIRCNSVLPGKHRGGRRSERDLTSRSPKPPTHRPLHQHVPSLNPILANNRNDPDKHQQRRLIRPNKESRPRTPRTIGSIRSTRRFSWTLYLFCK